MTEDSIVRVSSSNEASQSRQRKKRRWDQPAEALVAAAGMALPGVLPLGNAVPFSGTAFPVLTSVSGALLTNPLAASCATVPQVLQASSVQLHTAAAVQKLNQQKIQDELIIAREIVINDAESSVRYKLTKRQTQEEIQKCTGAVVITRGKYRLPNAPPDGEKPLYLHISAGAHLKETAERILAVDRAAAMVEEMLRQVPNSPPTSSTTTSHPPIANGVQVFSTCVFLGFDADPSLNIVARIRGPNDQYINHIMNETGATVVLKGSGSGNDEEPKGEVADRQQPLHLFLSTNNAKSLEDAKHLAENLLDTISAECGASRVSSCKVYSAVPPPQQVYSSVPPPQQVYGASPLTHQIASVISTPQQVYSAVPPPQQLLAGVQGSGTEVASTGLAPSSVSSSTALSPPVLPNSSALGSTVLALGTTPQSAGFLSSGPPQANVVGYAPPLVSGGTSYIGYGGIYPQATALQQVALALRHSPPVASIVAPTTSQLSGESRSITRSDPEKEKRPPQKRKFQELPVGSKGSTKLNQELEPLKASEQSDDPIVRNVLTMPAPKKLIKPTSNGMAPPPPRAMPPPPPPKFSAPPEVEVHDKSKILSKTKSDAAVPDTLIKLMEYGEDDDDVDDPSEESHIRETTPRGAQKPFWAL